MITGFAFPGRFPLQKLNPRIRTFRLSLTCITFSNVMKSYKNVIALKGVSFEVNCGDIIALVGPNGSGKSTLLKIAAGILKPDSGRVRVKGLDPMSEEAKKIIGYLAEEALPYINLSVRENLEYVARLRGLSDYQRRVDELLEVLGLKQYERSKVLSLSRGNRQKLAIAMAIVHKPEILLLDEPLNYLDIMTQEQVAEMIEELKATTLVSTHMLSIAERMASKVVLINKGELIGVMDMDYLKSLSPDGRVEKVILQILLRGKV